jgi:predicted RNA polymerase sigma factor
VTDRDIGAAVDAVWRIKSPRLIAALARRLRGVGLAEEIAQDACVAALFAPRLDAYSLSQIAKATALSLAACSRIRAGTRIPHPGHWDALRELVEDQNGSD